MKLAFFQYFVITNKWNNKGVIQLTQDLGSRTSSRPAVTRSGLAVRQYNIIIQCQISITGTKKLIEYLFYAVYLLHFTLSKVRL